MCFDPSFSQEQEAVISQEEKSTQQGETGTQVQPLPQQTVTQEQQQDQVVKVAFSGEAQSFSSKTDTQLSSPFTVAQRSESSTEGTPSVTLPPQLQVPQQAPPQGTTIQQFPLGYPVSQLERHHPSQESEIVPQLRGRVTTMTVALEEGLSTSPKRSPTISELMTSFLVKQDQREEKIGRAHV